MLALTDETFRDGPQSLWANRLRTEDMVPAAPRARAAGFGRINMLSGVGFEVAVKFLHENPLDRFRLLRHATAGVPSTILVRGRHLFSWPRFSDDVVTFFLETLAGYGLDEFEVFDGLNDMRNIEIHVREGVRLGMRVSGVLVFSESPVHTDVHFAERARHLAALGASAILLYDASGILRPERATSLILAIRAAAPGLPIEMNVHDQTGYALECYRAGIKAGAGHLSTAARPLAGGNSVPAAADVVALADELGVDIDVDRAAIDWLDEYFRYVAHVYGKPLVTHIEPDEERFRRYAGHQIPGGMMSHYESQLDGLGLLNRIDEVLEEAARVRVEIGCPVMVTPFSQLVGVQAMFNVLDGKRYHTVPADLRTYVRGYYGQPPGPIDPQVFDRLTDGQPALNATEIFNENMMDAMRREMPPGSGADEILFRLFSTAADVQAMRAQARHVRVRRVTPLIALIEQLTTRRNVTSLDISLRDKEDR